MRVPRPWRTGWPARDAPARHRRRQYRHEQGRGRPARPTTCTACGRFAPLADYFTVNVSSPNTPGLRALQNAAALSACWQGSTRCAARSPLLLKIAPDIAAEDEADIAELCWRTGSTALIVGNTTLDRPQPALAAGRRGRRAQRPAAVRALDPAAGAPRAAARRPGAAGRGRRHRHRGRRLCEDPRRGLGAAALHGPGLPGPGLVARILAELDACLARDGFDHVADAVGRDAAALAAADSSR